MLLLESSGYFVTPRAIEDDPFVLAYLKAGFKNKISSVGGESGSCLHVDEGAGPACTRVRCYFGHGRKRVSARDAHSLHHVESCLDIIVFDSKVPRSSLRCDFGTSAHDIVGDRIDAWRMIDLLPIHCSGSFCRLDQHANACLRPPRPL